ncbi:MAG: hypothetical protein KKA84_16260 [Bacteroidetes bacterium]|nr:hypothetical protein [Bacteroidota bacterium]
MKPKKTYVIYEKVNEEFFTHWENNIPMFTKDFSKARVFERIGNITRRRCLIQTYYNSIGSKRKVSSAVTHKFEKART